MYRPLSPHVLIYKSQFSSILSIFHRVTGIILTAAVAALWLTLCLGLVGPLRAHYVGFALSYYFNICSPWMSVVALALINLVLLCHIIGGIRHLLWDFYSSYWLSRVSIARGAYVILAFLTVVSVATILIV